jgi:MoxR-like ATPase
MIKKAIESNLPLLILGKSGWGKTALVEQAGNELGLEVVTLSLALCLPEDIGGIPKQSGESFSYLLPEWFHSRLGKDFVLFLDEINQAPPQVLHAIYGLVQKRELHGRVNKGMRVVAAGNLSEENPHLTEIMQPLLNRFYIYDYIHDPKPALEFLNGKYGLNLKEIENSPRDTEQGIVAFNAGLKDLAIKKAGMRVIRDMEGGCKSKADDLIQSVKNGKIKDRNGFI